MKKLVLALTAMAAFTAPALAADMAPAMPRLPVAAPVAYAPSWTGCYIAGGGGYGHVGTRKTACTTIGSPRGPQLVADTTAGGRGYFGTVGAGCDYQFPIRELGRCRRRFWRL